MSQDPSSQTRCIKLTVSWVWACQLTLKGVNRYQLQGGPALSVEQRNILVN